MLHISKCAGTSSICWLSLMSPAKIKPGVALVVLRYHILLPTKRGKGVLIQQKILQIYKANHFFKK